MIDEKRMVEAVARASLSVQHGADPASFPKPSSDDCARAAGVILALEAQGYRVVTVRLTGRMLADGVGSNLGQDRDLVNVAKRTWRAMLEAAPKVTGGGE